MSVKGTNKGCYDYCTDPGDFYFVKGAVTHRLGFLCPCGCGMLGGITVRADGVQSTDAWGWDKDEQAPTIVPSINLMDGPGQSHWHGYLTRGVFTAC